MAVLANSSNKRRGSWKLLATRHPDPDGLPLGARFSVGPSFMGRTPGLGGEKQQMQSDNRDEDLKSCMNVLELSVRDSKQTYS